MAGEFTPPSTSLSKSFFDKLVYNASIHQKHPACGNVHEWQVFDREKVAGSFGIARHSPKQGLCCFDRLERQGDNGLEHVVFVMGADGSIVAIRRGLDTF